MKSSAIYAADCKQYGGSIYPYISFLKFKLIKIFCTIKKNCSFYYRNLPTYNIPMKIKFPIISSSFDIFINFKVILFSNLK